MVFNGQYSQTAFFAFFRNFVRTYLIWEIYQPEISGATWFIHRQHLKIGLPIIKFATQLYHNGYIEREIVSHDAQASEVPGYNSSSLPNLEPHNTNHTDAKCQDKSNKDENVPVIVIQTKTKQLNNHKSTR